MEKCFVYTYTVTELLSILTHHFLFFFFWSVTPPMCTQTDPIIYRKWSINKDGCDFVCYNEIDFLVLVLNWLLQSPAFKFSRKASSSYSLRLESGRQKDHQRSLSGKRRTNSTPASPSHASSGNAGGAGAGGHHHHHHHHGASSSSAGGTGGSTASGATGTGREPQCTCMTPEQYARLRAQDPRFRGIVYIYHNNNINM